MQQPAPAPPTTDYRLTPVLVARLLGGLLVLLALVLAAITLLVVALDLTTAVLVAAAGVGLLGVAVTAAALVRVVPVIRLGTAGYRVRLLRRVGATSAPWADVTEAVAASPGGTPVVVIRLRDGRTTTIPVQVLAADREEFVRDLQRHLQASRGLRPL
ncbi:MAG: hypothetical protein WBP61_03920 [Nocardioides sp.]